MAKKKTEIEAKEQKVPVVDSKAKEQKAPVVDSKAKEQKAPVVDSKAKEQKAPVVDAKAKEQKAPVVDSKAKEQKAPVVDTKAKELEAPNVDSKAKEQKAPVVDTKAKEQNATADDTKGKELKAPGDSKISKGKIFFFGTILMTFCLVGMFISLRPQVSVLEKRNLATFPEITFLGVWNGTFFKDLDVWYSDTYPLREEMIAADKKVESEYGFRSEQIIEGKGDLARKPDAIKPVEAEKPEENLPDGTVRTIGEVRGSVYITNNCGYECYTFLEDLNLEFVQTMNNIYSRFKGVVDIYVMMVPTGAGVMLDKSVLDYLGTSDELAAVRFDYSKMDAGIKKVEVVETLRRHNAEYVYFHSDHHWTALGAYYAYLEFCKVKGIQPHDIKDYEKREQPGFLGSFYTESHQSPEIAANPDTVIAYIPKGTNKMTMVDENGATAEYNVINDMTGASPSAYYLTFVMGDAPLCYTHNETIHDGSAVLVIKDSHGNAFIPWLVDHYEYVYWIDPRYTTNTISQMIRDYGIKDVIYEVGIYGASNPYMYGRYDQIGW